MKNKITISLLLIILISFLYKSQIIYAVKADETDKQESFSDIQEGIKKEDMDSLLESGTVSTYGKKKQENVPTQVTSTGINIVNRVIGRLILILPMMANDLLSKITSTDGSVFTVEKAITNYYDLFNLKFLVSPLGGEVNEGNDEILESLGKNSATWFVGVRNLALAGSIITLIYVGIRLAIATTGMQRALYKKMLFSWLEGITIMVLLQFFIVFIIFASNWIVDLLKATMESDQSVIDVEEQIMKNVDTNLDEITELHSLIFYIMLYTVFTYYEFKFFILYMGRLVRISFFIIISPLVCLTYPIDKIGDGSAQAFNKWIREITLAIFIQPIHLLIYIVVIYSMGEIIIRNPILGVLFLAMLSHIEKEVKSMLKLNPVFEPGLKDIGIKNINKG